MIPKHLSFLLPLVLLVTLLPLRSSCETVVTSDAAHGVTRGPVSANQNDERLTRVLDNMESVYRKLKNFEAEFTQESETKALKRRKESGGKLYFQKPDKMRWEYLQPEPRDIYLIGKEMTVYSPGQNTVVRQSLNNTMGGTAPAELFLGPGALKQAFLISLAEPDITSEGFYCLRLIPRQRQGMNVEEILLWVSGKDYLPARTESRDILGNITKLRFLNTKTNVDLGAGIFAFQPPADAEIVENTY